MENSGQYFAYRKRVQQLVPGATCKFYRLRGYWAVRRPDANKETIASGETAYEAWENALNILAQN